VYGVNQAYANKAGYKVTQWFYDANVRGADPVTSRPGFTDMLDTIAGDGVRTVICESPDRFARDLIVQLTGHDYLKKLGVALIAASAPDHFLEDTPTAKLIRQVLGAVAEFEKANLVAKLKGARDRERAQTGKCGGRKTIAERDPRIVEAARALAAGEKRLSLREISAGLEEQGFVSAKGTPFSASRIADMIA
jgi:DNA invertase Pin-like site-specific DNA recombinase